MAGWFDRRDPQGHDAAEEFEQLKAMTRTGQPLDAATEERLREQLGGSFEPYKSVHNGVARLDRMDRKIKQVTRLLP